MKPLPHLCRELMREQLMTWPLLRENCAALQEVRTRTVDCGDYQVRLQFNPKRMTSTAARVEVARESCFLCAAERPEAQKGIPWGDRYAILCNPMPIFEDHYTIACTEHVPQSLFVKDLLLLSRDMGSDFVVFYNGPRCGASAPDHLHFQACPSFGFFRQEGRHPAAPVRSGAGVEIYNLEGISRGAAVFEGDRAESLEGMIRRFLFASKMIIPGDGEPMVNVVSSFVGKTWRVIIYPRMKHRPEAYYGRNGRTILVSPGAVDMSGLLVLPRETDFEQLDGRDISMIYEETGVESRTVLNILESM